MTRVVYHDGLLPPQGGTECKEESLTRQSEARDADINVILERFVKTGVMPVDTRDALYLDVSQMPDYQEVRNRIQLATEYFSTLDAKVRAKFNNDPALFLDELLKPENLEYFEESGIVEVTPERKAEKAAKLAELVAKQEAEVVARHRAAEQAGGASVKPPPAPPAV